METSNSSPTSFEEGKPSDKNLSLDDIIFEGRNKAYGAYRLRKLYNRHLAVSTAIAVTVFFVFSLALRKNIYRHFDIKK